MARRRAPPRRRGEQLQEGRRARLRDEDRADRPEGRLGLRRAGRERSCPGAKDLAGNRRVVLQEATMYRAFTTSSSRCS